MKHPVVVRWFFFFFFIFVSYDGKKFATTNLELTISTSPGTHMPVGIDTVPMLIRIFGLTPMTWGFSKTIITSYIELEIASRLKCQKLDFIGFKTIWGLPSHCLWLIPLSGESKLAHFFLSCSLSCLVHLSFVLPLFGYFLSQGQRPPPGLSLPPIWFELSINSSFGILFPIFQFSKQEEKMEILYTFSFSCFSFKSFHDFGKMVKKHQIKFSRMSVSPSSYFAKWPFSSTEGIGKPSWTPK